MQTLLQALAITCLHYHHNSNCQETQSRYTTNQLWSPDISNALFGLLLKNSLSSTTYAEKPTGTPPNAHRWIGKLISARSPLQHFRINLSSNWFTICSPQDDRYTNTRLSTAIVVPLVTVHRKIGYIFYNANTRTELSGQVHSCATFEIFAQTATPLEK